MHPLNALDMLDVWEAGYCCSGPERALLLLERAFPDEPREALAALPIGRRDRRLLALREWMFGPRLAGLAACPACGERLELSFTADDLRVGGQGKPKGEHSFRRAGYSIRFRLPNSLDLAELAGDENEEVSALRRRLLSRCLLAVRRKGKYEAAEELPAEVADALVKRMGQADPQADMRTSLNCRSCSHQWQTVFDIASFLWSEIDSWALRTLHEVHQLASAYGWSEAEVLSLSPWRRQFYLKCAASG